MPLRHQTKQLASQPAILVFKNLGARQVVKANPQIWLDGWGGPEPLHPSLDLLLKYTIVNLLCILNIFSQAIVIKILDS